MKLRIRIHPIDQPPTDETVEVPTGTTLIEIELSMWRDSADWSVNTKLAHRFLSVEPKPSK